MPLVRRGSGTAAPAPSPLLVDGGERLIQDPERRLVTEPQASQRDTALLAGGELTGGVFFKPGQTDLGQYPPQIHAGIGSMVQFLVKARFSSGVRAALTPGW